MSEAERIAREIMEEVCETDEVLEDYDMDLAEEGFIDSFALLEIILAIENKAGIKLQVSEINKDEICSINKLISFLESKL